MAESRLVTPDLVEQAVIDCLGADHKRHLAKLERQLGLNPESIGPFSTIDLLADDEQRFSLDELPCILLACRGDGEGSPEERFVDGARTSYSMTWRLELQVIDMGGGSDPRADAMQRARWRTMTTLECLLWRLPRQPNPIVNAVSLPSVPRFADVEGDANLAQGEAFLDLTAHDALTVSGWTIFDDQPDLYEPPVEGEPAADIDVDVTRQPLL